jgi:hypothetical protein
VRELPAAAPILEKLLREQGHAELIPTTATLTTGGTTFTATTDHAVGDPWDENGPLPDSVIEEKFRTFCGTWLSNSKIDSALTEVRTITDSPDVDGLVAALVSS